MLAERAIRAITTAQPTKTAWPVKTDFYRPVFCIMGLPFDAVTLKEAVASVRLAAKERRRCFVSTPNLNFVVGCLKDAAFRESVLQSDLSVADGMPLVWVARAYGLPLKERVAGSSIFDELRKTLQPPISTYLFGGPAGAAAKACEVLNTSGQGVVCCGFASPGFGTVEQLSTPETIAAINAANADFLVVALGARKGQLWLLRNLPSLNVPVVSHLGAVVNFIAGTVSRAPGRWQRLGLEWFWRIRQEPLLWQRYAKDGFQFFKLLVTDVLLAVVDARRHRPSPEALAGASVSWTRSGSLTVVAVAGDWTVDNLERMRAAFTEVADIHADVVVDLGEIAYFDSAWVALLLLLKGHQGKAQRTLRLRSVSSTTRRRLGLYGVNYLDVIA